MSKTHALDLSNGRTLLIGEEMGSLSIVFRNELVSVDTEGWSIKSTSEEDRCGLVSGLGQKKQRGKRAGPCGSAAVASGASESTSLNPIVTAEYDWSKLTDKEIVAAAVSIFDRIIGTTMGFKRTANIRPWDNIGGRSQIVWNLVCEIFESLTGTPLDAAISGLEDEEIDAIISIQQ